MVTNVAFGREMLPVRPLRQRPRSPTDGELTSSARVFEVVSSGRSSNDSRTGDGDLRGADRGSLA